MQSVHQFTHAFCYLQSQVKELRAQVEQELKSHQATKDQMAVKEANIVELKQEVWCSWANHIPPSSQKCLFYFDFYEQWSFFSEIVMKLIDSQSILDFNLKIGMYNSAGHLVCAKSDNDFLFFKKKRQVVKCSV